MRKLSDWVMKFKYYRIQCQFPLFLVVEFVSLKELVITTEIAFGNIIHLFCSFDIPNIFYQYILTGIEIFSFSVDYQKCEYT